MEPADGDVNGGGKAVGQRASGPRFLMLVGSTRILPDGRLIAILERHAPAEEVVICDVMVDFLSNLLILSIRNKQPELYPVFERFARATLIPWAFPGPSSHRSRPPPSAEDYLGADPADRQFQRLLRRQRRRRHLENKMLFWLKKMPTLPEDPAESEPSPPVAVNQFRCEQWMPGGMLPGLAQLLEGLHDSRTEGGTEMAVAESGPIAGLSDRAVEQMMRAFQAELGPRKRFSEGRQTLSLRLPVEEGLEELSSEPRPLVHQLSNPDAENDPPQADHEGELIINHGIQGEIIEVQREFAGDQGKLVGKEVNQGKKANLSNDQGDLICHEGELIVNHGDRVGVVVVQTKLIGDQSELLCEQYHQGKKVKLNNDQDDLINHQGELIVNHGAQGEVIDVQGELIGDQGDDGDEGKQGAASLAHLYEAPTPDAPQPLATQPPGGPTIQEAECKSTDLPVKSDEADCHLYDLLLSVFHSTTQGVSTERIHDMCLRALHKLLHSSSPLAVSTKTGTYFSPQAAAAADLLFEAHLAHPEFQKDQARLGCFQRSLTEFLAAKWLFENWEVHRAHVSSMLLDSQYSSLCVTFSLMLAESNQLHKRIILQKFEEINLQLLNEEAMRVDKARRTPLHLASHIGNIEAVKMLLQHGVPINALDKLHGTTALYYAVNSRSWPVVTMLLREGAHVCKKKNVAGKKWVKKILISSNLPIGIQFEIDWPVHLLKDDASSTILQCAVMLKSPLLVKNILHLHPDVNAADAGGHCTAVDYALEAGEWDVLKLLIQSGATVRANVSDHPAVRNLYEKGFQPLYSQFQINWPALHPPSNMRLFDSAATPLQAAAILGVEYIEALKELAPDVEAVDSGGQSPLQWAVAARKWKSVIRLVELGATVFQDVSTSAVSQKLRARGFAPTVARFNKDWPVVSLGSGSCGTLLHAAVRSKKYILVEEALKMGINLEVVDTEEQWTPLYLAVEEQSWSVVRLLVENGAFVKQDVRSDISLHNATNCLKALEINWPVLKDPKFGWLTPLQNASAHGDVKEVNKLLELKADPKVKAEEEQLSAVYLATMHNKWDVVRLLVNNGGEVQFNIGMAPALQWTLNHPKVTEKMTSFEAHWPAVRLQGEQYFTTVLHAAAQLGHLDTMTFLISEQHVHPSVQDPSLRTPLHSAVQAPNAADAVYRLIELGADVNARNSSNETALVQAICRGKVGIARLLVRGGARISLPTGPQNRTAVHWAAWIGDLGLLSALLAAGRLNVDALDSNGLTALMVAARHRHQQVAIRLVAESGDLNARDHLGRSALHDAAAHGLPELAQALLRGGAEVNALSNSGETPLHEASCMGSGYVVEILLQYNAEVNARTVSGRTPLHMAVNHMQHHVVTLLLKAGADPNLPDGEGDTALHHAARSAPLIVVKKLIKAGGNVQLRNKDQETPHKIAKMSGQNHLLPYLQRRKACVVM